ncbi:ImuA family protein [Daejeonella lutea]|uniref:Protein ImuA n=1 Tax=Daejeonella lutea TaxID=572036 RepID=A0A1T5EHW3_9SPHI|nr:Error-prone repair protein ImuA [Daejeonella lutea]SKB83320.1 protein ImuA [Daejeonella lutea]
MYLPQTKKDIINQLQKSILLMQGFTPPVSAAADSVGLGAIEAAFPNGVFPRGAIHEFLSAAPEQAAANGGFISGILNTLMQQGGACLWISMSRTLFPPSLKIFGVEPDRLIFVDLKREKDVLWAMEEALKCNGLAAVIGELSEISFTQTRRLQLAAEQSRVTGFVLRSNPKKLSATACVARWNISSLPSELEEGMPGVGFPRWTVELLKVRNGNPGSWGIEWSDGGFRSIRSQPKVALLKRERLKVG